jgi:hypothetical protein
MYGLKPPLSHGGLSCRVIGVRSRKINLPQGETDTCSAYATRTSES